MRLVCLLVLFVLPLAGCSFDQPLPEKQRFILTGTEPDAPIGSGGGGTLRIHRFRAASVFERNALVYRTDDDLFVEDFYNEFYAQPGMMVREITLRYLQAAGIFDVVLEPNDSRRADWLLEGRIENLYADLRDRDRPAAIVDIGFSLVDESSPDLATIFQQRYEERIEAESDQAHDLVRAMARGMNSIFERLAADLVETIDALREGESPSESTDPGG
ncbi:MAG: membrane integrity-associated transporter subunit PqiC [Deltaproteobacteria bacterium]|jgi:uncharacterized lipoprotein YmbA|nr:membrane integrity-associated transporter subunit PqiC [Deltaproteobacteria bacterium]